MDMLGFPNFNPGNGAPKPDAAEALRLAKEKLGVWNAGKDNYRTIPPRGLGIELGGRRIVFSAAEAPTQNLGRTG